MRPTAVLAAAALIVVVPPTATSGQQAARWVVEQRGSLVWWQIDPHLGHLWATTCPDDPSWQPGEGHSPNYYTNWSERRRIALNDTPDDRIPLFPRRTVRFLCRQAVRGVLTASGLESWEGAGGTISVAVDSLVTGLDLRDRFARTKVFDTARYPDMRFTIEEITHVQPGDTVRATVRGRFELHGVTTPLDVPVKAWLEGDLLRVVGSFAIPARDLTKVYGMSEFALGMGVKMRVWRMIHAGMDLVLRPVADAAGGAR
jgi:hypothetical protein